MLEKIKTALAKYRMLIWLILLGLVLVSYGVLAFQYYEQPLSRQELNKQILAFMQKLDTPVADITLLRDQIAEIDSDLAPISNNEAIVLLLDLARATGIDVSEELGNFIVPIPENSVSGGYKVTTFKGVHVQGKAENVLEYIRILDSNERLNSSLFPVPRTVVRSVDSVSLAEVDAYPIGEDAERRVECRDVADAVREMMEDNFLLWIPRPFGADGAKATNRMGDDPATINIFDGFPDNATTAAQKGYTGNATPKSGYLLYQHDKINTSNSTQYNTVNYYPALTTKYFYTVDVDGKVRQWKSSNAIPIDEYTDCGLVKKELRANLNIRIYYK